MARSLARIAVILTLTAAILMTLSTAAFAIPGWNGCVNVNGEIVCPPQR
jgi:hypothetical protein